MILRRFGFSLFFIINTIAWFFFNYKVCNSILTPPFCYKGTDHFHLERMVTEENVNVVKLSYLDYARFELSACINIYINLRSEEIKHTFRYSIQRMLYSSNKCSYKQKLIIIWNALLSILSHPTHFVILATFRNTSGSLLS